MKTAFITGVTGQDGSYLAELLLSKNYKVIGLKRRTSLIATERIDQIFNNKNFKLEYFELDDHLSFYRLLQKHEPDEIYNLAAQSHVRVSFDVPTSTINSIVNGTLGLLEAIRNFRDTKEVKFYQASSSEMFGDNPNAPFSEESILMPASPYANAKVFAHNLMRNYRKSYGMFCSSGILFNHESPRRGETFVTRKITLAAARIKAGLQDKIHLGNLDAKRDWGFAGDYVEAMWLMLQQEQPDDFVVATGETYTVRQFLNEVFEHAGLDVEKHLVTDPRLYRPHEVPFLLGDNTKAKNVLNWEPKIKFQQLARMMYDSDYQNTIRSNK